MEIAGRLTKQGRTILDVDLSLPIPDKVCGIFGPSGAGKTTLLRCIAGVEPNFEGRIAQGSHANSVRIALVFQDSALFPHLNVEQNLQFARRHAVQKQHAPSLQELADLLECDHLLQQRVDALSGGEQQRVALARALMNNPDVLLLDEPVSALDEHRRYRILKRLMEIGQQHGISMIMVSHSLRELAFISDHIVHIEDGKNIAEGETTSILNALQKPSEAGYRSLFSLLHGNLVQTHSEFDLAELSCEGQRLYVQHTSTLGDELRVKVEANQVSLDLSPPQQSSIMNCLKAEVIEVSEIAEKHALVTLAIGEQILLAEISAWSAQRLNIHQGQHLYARFKLP